MRFYILTHCDLGVPCGSDKGYIAIPRIPPRYSVSLRARIAKRDLAVEALALVALAPTHTHRMHETGRQSAAAETEHREVARTRARRGRGARRAAPLSRSSLPCHARATR